MANTTPDNIYYPVDGDQVAPLASHFQNLAETTQDALNTKPDTADLPDIVTELEALDYAKFDTTYAGGSTQPGMLAWDQDNETLEFMLDDHVTLQIGQEHVMRVKNASGSVAIPERTIVMFAGATGDTITVSPAISDGTVNINYLAGITTEEIPADGFGFVTQLGFINQVDTNGWPVGTILYPNPLVPGGFTDVEPDAPNWKTPIAAVTKQSTTAGRMLVRAIGGGGGGGASVVIADVVPESGTKGDLWLDSTDGTMYVYFEDVDGSQWIQVQANSALEGSILQRLSSLESQAIAYGTQSPNYIINGGFDFWQRGTAVAGGTTSPYTVDRFRCYSAAASTVARVTAGVPSPFTYAAEVKATATNSAIVFGTQIEYLQFAPLLGKKFTFSFWAKALTANSASKNLTVYFRTSTSVDASIFYNVAAIQTASITIDNTLWNQYTVSSTSILAADVRSLSIEIAGANLAANDGFQMAGWQLEAGTTATAFRRNQPNIQAELAACQRYYEIGNYSLVWPAYVNAAISRAMVSFKSTKRDNLATVTLSSTYVSSAGAAVTSTIHPDGFRVQSSSSGTSPGAESTGTWTAEREL